jgi:tetratricopeptide (TPR) repeat protein
MTVMKRMYTILLSILVCWLAAAQTGQDDYLHGVADVMKEDYTSAVDNLTMALESGLPGYRVLMKRGEAWYNLGQFDLAIRDFIEVNAILPEAADFWLSKCYAAIGNVRSAVSSLERHLRSDFRLPEEEIKKDPAFDALQLSDEWFLLWQGDWYNAEEKVIQEASYHLERGSTGDALNEIESALAKGIEGSGILAFRGRIYLEEHNFGPAISDFTVALEREDNNDQYYFYRGVANIGVGRFKEAVGDFTRVLREEPDRFEAYLLRAKAYAGMKSYDLALEDANTYLEYFDSDQDAIFLCGGIYFQQGDYLSALECYNKNMKSDPYNAAYFKARGMTYAMTRTFQYAVNDLSMSLDLDPSDGETWLYLGIAELGSGNGTAACSDFEQARRLGEARALEYIVEKCQ